MCIISVSCNVYFSADYHQAEHNFEESTLPSSQLMDKNSIEVIQLSC